MSSTSLENCIRYSGRKEKELSMCFNFHHLKVDYKDGDKWTLMEPDRMALKKLFETWQMGMQAGNLSSYDAGNSLCLSGRGTGNDQCPLQRYFPVP